MASIIETLYILIKADTKDVKKGTQEAKKSADNLNESLNKTSPAAAKVTSSFQGIAKSLAGIATAGLSVGAIVGSLKSAADYSLNVGNTARALGANVEDLDAWGSAVRRNGGSAEAFQSSFKQLTKQLGGNAQVAMKVLPMFADVLKELDMPRARRYAELLGIDDQTLVFLRQGSSAVEAQVGRQKQLGVVTEENSKKAQEFKRSLEDMKTSARGLSLEIESAMIPALGLFFGKVTEGFQYLKANSNDVIGGLTGIAVAATAVAAPLIAAAAPVVTLVGLFAALGVGAAEAFKHIKEGTDVLTKMKAPSSLGSLFGTRDQLGIASAGTGSGLGENINLPFLPSSGLQTAAAGISNSTQNSSNVSVGDVIFNGVKSYNPEEHAAMFMGVLNKEFQQANAQADNGVEI